MEPEAIAGWITAIGMAIVAVLGATWGVLQKIKAGRIVLKTDEAVAGLEVSQRIKADSARREQERLEQQAEHYKSIIKEDRKQFDKLDRRMDEALAMVEKMQDKHLQCEKDLATERQRGVDQGQRIARQDEMIADLEARLASLEHDRDETA